MTTTPLPDAAAASGRPALARLLRLPVDEFARDYWGQRPLVSTAAELGGDFGDLFSNAAVDELISVRGLRTPFLRVAKDGKTLGDNEFTGPGGVGATIGDQLSEDRLLRLFAGGSTLVLQALHRTWEPLIDFGGQLGEDLGHPVQINSYVTPAQNTGFSSHYDVHDVFVLQISGEKRWHIRPPVLPVPLRTQPWDQRRDAVAAASELPAELEITMRPGDVLYLPRGYLHAATALGEISTHLTVGVHAWTRTHLLQRLTAVAAARLAGDERLRASLPLGLDWSQDPVPATDVELVRSALLDAVAAATAEEITAGLVGEHRGGGRAAPVGPVAGVTAAAELTTGTRLTVRPRLAARKVTLEDNGIRVISRAGTSEFTAADSDAVTTLLDLGELVVADLDLGRRLIVEGLAVAEDV